MKKVYEELLPTVDVDSLFVTDNCVLSKSIGWLHVELDGTLIEGSVIETNNTVE